MLHLLENSSIKSLSVYFVIYKLFHNLHY